MRIDGIVGHPGIAPLIWWILGMGVFFQVLFVVGTLTRYRRLRPQSNEEKAVLLLPLAGNVCFSSGILLMLVVMQMDLVGQAPFVAVLLSVVIATIGTLVYSLTNRG